MATQIRTPRRTRQFFGDSTTKGVLAVPTAADVIQLLPTQTAIEGSSDVTHKITFLDFSITRAGTNTAINKLGYIVWMGKVLLGTSTPVQPHDPLSASSFAMSDKDIMLFGSLPVPPVVFNGEASSTAFADGSVLSVQREVKAMRKLSRLNHGIFLQLATDVVSTIDVVVTWRTIYLT